MTTISDGLRHRVKFDTAANRHKTQQTALMETAADTIDALVAALEEARKILEEEFGCVPPNVDRALAFARRG